MAAKLVIVASAAMMLIQSCSSFSLSPIQSSTNNAFIHQSTPKSTSAIFMSTATDQENIGNKKGYVPKWKKKETLADITGTSDIDAKDKGLVGSVPIIFQQGSGESATLIETTALPGQPFKLVASQAGQYIKYGCGKGECGTCESLCNGKYLRPCVDVVPTDLELDAATGAYPPLRILVKGTKAKVVSSGKFFSAKSFVLGFWNNLLGMLGFVRDRRKARKNWQERMEKEAEIARLAEEKRRRRAEETAASNSSQ
ncbi:hypothetical protein ACHAWU_001168 [Discostella pseudostelligera]|uniref:2Fe-2S ferredoxin-type domain-containing protein n=1 Tax=Discostella pseudostelligera TaxID=259834 RepID=A0ABD3MFZ3_9STRA